MFIMIIVMSLKLIRIFNIKIIIMEKVLTFIGCLPWYFWGLLVFNLFVAFIVAVCEVEKHKKRAMFFTWIWIVGSAAASLIIAIVSSESLSYSILVILSLAFPICFFSLIFQGCFIDLLMKAYYKKQRHHWGIPQLLEQSSLSRYQEKDVTYLNWQDKKDDRLAKRFWKFVFNLKA